jgi:hypothetical protein
MVERVVLNTLLMRFSANNLIVFGEADPAL